jgi:hypothetical protein
MRRWLVIAGLPGVRSYEFRRQLLMRGYEIQTLEGDSSKQLHKSYVDFVETCVGAGGQGHGEQKSQFWLGMIGMADASDDLERSYYEYFKIWPPSALVLLSPSVSPFYLNEITCPYLILHGQRDPLFAVVSPTTFAKAVYHHQMRYGDPTKDHLERGLDRNLSVSPEGQLDEAVGVEIINWLEQVQRFAKRSAYYARKLAA